MARSAKAVCPECGSTLRYVEDFYEGKAPEPGPSGIRIQVNHPCRCRTYSVAPVPAEKPAQVQP